jgi:hypothetical protein
MVAETLMKKLYNRNKDVEKYHKQKESHSPQKGAVPTNELQGDLTPKNDTDKDDVDFSGEIDMIQEFKKREENMQ